MTPYIEAAPYVIVAVFAIYGLYELYLRFLPCETVHDDRRET